MRDGGVPDPMIDDLGPINTTPCTFDLNTTEPGASYLIDCRMDLDEAIVTLAANVTLTFGGGEVIDGTLAFSGGQIDGRLLNDSLAIDGDAELIDPSFTFYPQRWRTIVQGPASDEVARQNRDAFNDVLALTHRLSATQFRMGTFDAFFKVDGPLSSGTPADHAINLPGDFHLAMSSSTHLRMQPHGHFRAALVAIKLVDGVTVTGGNLHGERAEHDYESGYVDSDGATGDTHEWVHLLVIESAQNIDIDSVTMSDATGDNLNISGIYHYFDERHVRARDIVIRNSRLLRARRTNLVITNGERITIEGNEIVDGGVDLPGSPATAPSSNLNIEPFRTRDGDGNLIEYERVNDVLIRGNAFLVNDRENQLRAGGVQLSHGNGPIVVDSNTFTDNGVSFSTTDGVEIVNNTLAGGGIGAGIAENFGREDFVFGNLVHGNRVTAGGGVALLAAGNGVAVYENILEGATGISIGAGGSSEEGASNIEIWSNEITASSRGILSMNTSQNVVVHDNTIDMVDGPFAVVLDNAWSSASDANFVFRANTVTGREAGTMSGAPATLLGAHSLTVTGNTMGDLQISGGARMTIEGNTFDARVGAHGVQFTHDAPDTSITGNTIRTYPSATPLNVQCVFVTAGAILSASVVTAPNTCLEF